MWSRLGGKSLDAPQLSPAESQTKLFEQNNQQTEENQMFCFVLFIRPQSERSKPAIRGIVRSQDFEAFNDIPV